MRLRSTGLRATAAGLVVLGLAAATAAGTYAARNGDDDDNDARRIAMRDDCDPSDPGWATAPGGCVRKRGNVSLAEFQSAVLSPLSTAVVGHQAWRNDPSYMVIKEGTTLRVKNAGGRPHTFTKVARFGGGVNSPPPLHTGLTTAPECPLSIGILPGDSVKLSDLPAGDHLFMCCFHPWMRAQIKVLPSPAGNDDDDDHGRHH